ncbi:glutathionylspermidine synthase family protein [Calidifontibacillus erzurumensis]|uniref:Glutathionylspermidine synthase family protein n=1 Tax=Calidifontibacillus erzurumensis TaxID=2741433 RepID=A0A8J8KFS4_9BACI|nr:glutathionylspermidine synthase family protein [Calidifontibacillus erzurumensis]NSL53230.1 glutathionylspermidine synthase family protein [Calidifontibacillus erzurumensis]
MDRKTYILERERFYTKIDHFWADLYGEEYALYDIALIDEMELEKIRLASARIGAIFFKTAKLLRKVPDATLLEMGFPKETLSFIRLKTLPVESVISRLDLIKTENGYKCIEINADTPTFIKELYAINDIVCKEFKVKNPNAHMEQQLCQAIRKSIDQSTKWLGISHPSVVFTAHDDHIEDRETVHYLRNLSSLDAPFVPLNQLQIEKGVGLFDNNDMKIDILYRQTFPIENLILDEDDHGNKIGLWLLELVSDRKLAIINPPSAFLLQNKAVQAVIWGLHAESSLFFTDEEHDWIEKYFLPTYLEPDFFIKNGFVYVKKPSFGREGDTVEIFSPDGIVQYSDAQKSYTNYIPVYQQYIKHPTIRFQSEKGEQEGNLLVGSFLINGQPSAIGFRVGGMITNNLSYYLPIALK